MKTLPRLGLLPAKPLGFQAHDTQVPHALSVGDKLRCNIKKPRGELTATQIGKAP